MPKVKKEKQKVSRKYHPRNRNKDNYDFEAMVEGFPPLKAFIQDNFKGEASIDFENKEAVKALNQAILKHYYGIEKWDIPTDYSVPPIPLRADYIHHLADFVRRSNFGHMLKGKAIKCFDVGMGASAILPLIGAVEYDWSFIASDIDSDALVSADQIIEDNIQLTDNIESRFQSDAKDFFYSVLKKEEKIDFTFSIPPVNDTPEVNKNEVSLANQGLESVNNENNYKGGEERFIKNMILQSKKFADSCFWFSTLVSKQSDLKNYEDTLHDMRAFDVQNFSIGQGNKTNQVLIWTFLNKDQQAIWRSERWQAKKKS